jgi:hypothetical protein
MTRPEMDPRRLWAYKSCAEKTLIKIAVNSKNILKENNRIPDHLFDMIHLGYCRFPERKQISTTYLEPIS